MPEQNEHGSMSSLVDGVLLAFSWGGTSGGWNVLGIHSGMLAHCGVTTHPSSRIISTVAPSPAQRQHKTGSKLTPPKSRGTRTATERFRVSK